MKTTNYKYTELSDSFGIYIPSTYMIIICNEQRDDKTNRTLYMYCSAINVIFVVSSSQMAKRHYWKIG